MNKINYKLYIMALTELLINKNSETDLKTHVLEYCTDFEEIGGQDNYNGDACLAVAVRLKNKKTGLIEWGNIYYKTLLKNSDVSGKESKEKIRNILKQILKSSYEEKIEFILRAENNFLKKPYKKYMFISPQLTDFFDNLNGQTLDGYTTTNIDGKFPANIIPEIDSVFNDIITENQQLSSKKKY